MNCTTDTGCSGECLQGRLCDRSFMATRRVLGLTTEQIASLEQRVGGQIIQDGHSVVEEFTADEAADTAFALLVTLVCFVVGLPLAVWLWFVL